jgi:hypothetical protein
MTALYKHVASKSYVETYEWNAVTRGPEVDGNVGLLISLLYIH